MRAPDDAGLSRRGAVAIVIGSLLLHAVALWWVVQRLRASDGGEAAAIAPAMFAVFVRPEQRAAAPVEPAPRPRMRGTPPETRRAPAPSVAAAIVPSAAAASHAELRTDMLPVVASAEGRAFEAAPVPPAAAPLAAPAELTVARPDHGQCPLANYPVLLREQGIEGVVTLRVRVDPLGRPAEVQLLQPSGWRLFDEAALQQVRACRFLPARRGVEAIASWVEFPVRFTLAG